MFVRSSRIVSVLVLSLALTLGLSACTHDDALIVGGIALGMLARTSVTYGEPAYYYVAPQSCQTSCASVVRGIAQCQTFCY